MYRYHVTRFSAYLPLALFPSCCSPASFPSRLYISSFISFLYSLYYISLFNHNPQPLPFLTLPYFSLSLLSPACLLSRFSSSEYFHYSIILWFKLLYVYQHNKLNLYLTLFFFVDFQNSPGEPWTCHGWLLHWRTLFHGFPWQKFWCFNQVVKKSQIAVNGTQGLLCFWKILHKRSWF